MRATKDVPILTDTYESAADFRPVGNCIYVFASAGEARAKHMESWRASAGAVRFCEVEAEDFDQFRIKETGETLSLRSAVQLASVWNGLDDDATIYIDITGLTHAVWAGLLKSAIREKKRVFAVYVEPDQYSRSAAPVEGQVYDLSTSIQGIMPLAGYAVLSPKNNVDFTFVPLLGFEGTRLRHVIEQVQPGYERITPVIGSPGFKPWYVFETYLGNRAALMETEAWQAVRYAPANCPFSCFYLLQEIAAGTNAGSLKIALVGTKPHALGAVLFALTSTTPTELVYDHPIRKAGRTNGTARLHVYHVSAVFDANASVFTVPERIRDRRAAHR
ncbi:hypothetical protein R69776_05918 [Paraburkholderia nemoris]|uniref:Uncharacterized protein n=1 Tax=Paraburkholderia nemoris TaxID=2793076 RepID=A0ABN7MU83_9BURK|nr:MULTISPECIES: hypothetical protein [Paraburkholderia]CAE6816114.1 hypothetical protein R69776_05918 [Paraburkholderia nemoris]